MKEIRSLGNTIGYLSSQNGVTVEDLSHVLNRPVDEIKRSLAGRSIFSYQQLEKIADKLQVKVDDLFTEMPQNDLVCNMDCMNAFVNPDHREEIIDMIYDYLDVYDHVYSSGQE